MRFATLIVLLMIWGLFPGCSSSNEVAVEESPNSGIQVNGHWIVTVADPDGSIVGTHEFDNALGDHGANLLSLLLEGATKVGSHEVMIRRESGATWRCEEDYGVGGVYLYVPAVAARQEMVNRMPLRWGTVCTVKDLIGDAEIVALTTRAKTEDGAGYCVNNACTDASLNAQLKAWPFTAHDVSIPVSNNQLVAINVVFSFD